jgi:PhnB protein
VTDVLGERRDTVARVSTYLNFMGNTEEAFEFYRGVFGTEFVAPIQRLGDVPADPRGPILTEAEKQMVLHVELPILGGHVLMATDMVASMGHELKVGNNTTINLEPDSREETQRLYDALSEGASDCAPLADMFWGATWGTCLDRFGVRWMFNFPIADQ